MLRDNFLYLLGLVGGILLDGAQKIAQSGNELGSQPAVVSPRVEVSPASVVPHLVVAQPVMTINEQKMLG